MEDDDGLSCGGVPDITQFLSVHMDEDDVIEAGEPFIITDTFDSPPDGLQEGFQFTVGEVGDVDNPLLVNPGDGIGEDPLAPIAQLVASKAEVYLVSSKECPVCGKAVSKSKMKVHMRIHTGEKPFQCEVCEKRFSRSDKLTAHKRTHTGEKPHICFCGKRFARHDHMKLHATTHHVDELSRDALLTEAKNIDLLRRGLHVPLPTTIPNACMYCGRVFTQNYKFKRHLRTHTGEKPYVCFCGQCFSRSEKLRHHQINQHNYYPSKGKQIFPNEGPFRLVENANLEVNQPAAGIVEMTEVKIPKPVSDISETNGTTETNCSEKVTDESDKNASVLGSAKKQDDSEEKVDQNGGQSLPRQGGVHCCEFCPKTFKKAHKLSIHRRTHTGEKPHKCESCGKPFARRDHMLKHMKIHLKRRQDSVMKTLNVWFDEQKSIYEKLLLKEEEPNDMLTEDPNDMLKEDANDMLKEEPNDMLKEEPNDMLKEEPNNVLKEEPDDVIEDIKIEEESLDVDECSTVSPESEEKERTRKVKVESEEQHTCQVCGHTFKKLYNLQSHMKIHMERSLYECGVCGKQFKVERNYEAHLLNHGKEVALSQIGLETTDLDSARSKRVQCSVCGKWLVSMSSLEMHVRSHTGERPHKCSICESTFVRKPDMLRHMKSHTGEKPHKCEHCSITFSRKDKLSFHIKKHHQV